MASTVQDTQAKNTPQPYGGGELSGPGRSTSGVDANTSPAADASSKTSLASGGQSQTPAASQRQTRSQSRSASQSQSGNVGGRKDTKGVAEPAEEEGGAARGEGTKVTEEEGAPSKDTEPPGGYPEQRHAGHLDGPGPEYGMNHRVTIADRLKGVKEEVKGIVKRDPELKKTGKERMTGELKRKENDAEHGTEAFQNDEDGDKKKEKDEDKDKPDTKKSRTEKTDEPGLTEHPQAHPTEKGREEQASSVQPEGTGSAPSQP